MSVRRNHGLRMVVLLALQAAWLGCRLSPASSDTPEPSAVREARYLPALAAGTVLHDDGGAGAFAVLADGTSMLAWNAPDGARRSCVAPAQAGGLRVHTFSEALKELGDVPVEVRADDAAERIEPRRYYVFTGQECALMGVDASAGPVAPGSGRAESRVALYLRELLPYALSRVLDACDAVPADRVFRVEPEECRVVVDSGASGPVETDAAPGRSTRRLPVVAAGTFLRDSERLGRFAVLEDGTSMFVFRGASDGARRTCIAGPEDDGSWIQRGLDQIGGEGVTVHVAEPRGFGPPSPRRYYVPRDDDYVLLATDSTAGPLPPGSGAADGTAEYWLREVIPHRIGELLADCGDVGNERLMQIDPAACEVVETTFVVDASRH